MTPRTQVLRLAVLALILALVIVYELLPERGRPVFPQREQISSKVP